MTVLDELTLIRKGYSRDEIKEMKEREKTEAGETEKKEEPEKKDDPEKKEEPEKKDDPENVSRETSKKDEPDKKDESDKDAKIKELETQLLKAQEENIHRDSSGEVDNRSDFDKCVDIFKNSF